MQIISIIEESIDGDTKAIKQLYDAFADEMFSSSFRITNDIHASEDIIQESFLKSLEKLSSLKTKSNYQGWYRRIVINASLAHVKKRFKFDDIKENILITEEENQSWFMDIPLSTIKMAIQELPSRSRTIFSLFAIEDYKHSEIADQLGISKSTSKTQYQYAKKLLQSYLAKTFVQ